MCLAKVSCTNRRAFVLDDFDYKFWQYIRDDVDNDDDDLAKETVFSIMCTKVELNHESIRIS